MKIRFLGAHNCESDSTRLCSILIDGLLALDAGGLTGSLSFAEQQKLKALAITHGHYDHIRDLPILSMNLYLHETRLNVYSIPEVREALSRHLFGDSLYRNFLVWPEGEPTIIFNEINPLSPSQIDEYSLLPVPVNHSVASVGLQITGTDGKCLFYTGDTGPGLADCWKHLSEPGLIIIDVTAPDCYEDFGRSSLHLTPSMLQAELEEFHRIKGYLPRIMLVHMNPRQEREIAAEAELVGKALGCSISLAQEGMEVVV